jgi:hypothetical protein
MTTETITIRTATVADQAGLERLAALDSSSLPAGQLVVAESAGELRAAVEVGSGTAIADPFFPTADIVALLRESVRSAREQRRRSHRTRAAARASAGLA